MNSREVFLWMLRNPRAAWYALHAAAHHEAHALHQARMFLQWLNAQTRELPHEETRNQSEWN